VLVALTTFLRFERFKMKKLLSIFFIASAIFVGTANAEVGTVDSVTQKADGTVMVCVDTGAGNPKCAILKGSADSIKTMTAMAMTVKTTGGNLLVRFNNGGWNFMVMQ